MNATCRSCGAEIVWCWTPNGKRMPLDARMVTVFVPVGEPDLDGMAKMETHRGYLAHWGSCPSAGQHRKSA